MPTLKMKKSEKKMCYKRLKKNMKKIRKNFLINPTFKRKNNQK